MLSVKSLTGIGGACALLAACAMSTEVPSPTRAATGTAAFSAGGGGHTVTGSGHTSIGMTDDLREFTFHAIEHPDGTVDGSYKIERTDSGQYFIVDVSCLSVVGNTGWVAGHIVATNIPTVRLGTVSYFFAEDNGEGNDPPDKVSLARVNDVPGADVEFCTTRPKLLPTLTVGMGNVQVR